MRVFGAKRSSSVGPIGIDFGANAARLLQLRRKSGGWRVVGATRIEFAGRGEQAELTTDQTRAALAAGGFIGRRCIVSLERSDLLLQSVRMPQLKDAEMKQAALWEAAERFGRKREDLEVDFIRMGEVQRGSETRDEVLLLAAMRDRLLARLNPLMEANLRPIAVDTSFAALARTYSLRCRREADQSHVRGLLEVGGGGSTFLVLRGDQIALCKPIEIGGRAFDLAVAEHLGIEVDIAHQLRTRRIANRHRVGGSSNAPDDETDRAVFEAVRTLLDRLVKEVSLCMRYYGVTFRGRPVDRIILAGGDSLEPRLDAMLADATKLPVSTDDPDSPAAELFSAIETAVGVNAGPAQCWATAAGLSLRGMSARSLLEPASTSEPRRIAA